MLCDWKFPATLTSCHPALLDPWEAALDLGEDVVIALLTNTHGPAYRNPGAAIAIATDGRFAGAITSGCVEADLILRAEEVRRTGRVQNLRYGEGSPFFDLRLPCGGAVEVALFTLRDRPALIELSRAREARQAVSLRLSADGRLGCRPWATTGSNTSGFTLGFTPPLRFAIFGTGPEAALFAGLVRTIGHEHLLISHEEPSLAAARAVGCITRRLVSLDDIADLRIDAATAAVLFYHDHDYEPEILRRLLMTPAFYIGAQGSRATQAARLTRLAGMGVDECALTRVRGPIGLIPSSRDPRDLAISVLAEITELQGAISSFEIPQETA